MKYLAINKDEIIKHISLGSLVFMPTNTIPGIVCSALNKQAVEKIYDVKKRDLDKPPTIIISRYSQLDILNVEPISKEILSKYWPGKVSVIFKVKQNNIENMQYLHRGKNSLAIRLVDRKELIDILDKTGPLATSSANLQGSEPILDKSEAIKYFGNNIDLYIDVDKRDINPSTIIEILENGEINRLR